jgi:hypothetical protein
MLKICQLAFVAITSVFFGWVGFSVLRGVIAYHTKWGVDWKLVLSVPFICVCFGILIWGVWAILDEMCR